jgi:hypothetical protein
MELRNTTFVLFVAALGSLAGACGGAEGSSSEQAAATAGPSLSICENSDGSYAFSASGLLDGSRVYFGFAGPDASNGGTWTRELVQSTVTAAGGATASLDPLFSGAEYAVAVGQDGSGAWLQFGRDAIGSITPCAPQCSYGTCGPGVGFCCDGYACLYGHCKLLCTPGPKGTCI